MNLYGEFKKCSGWTDIFIYPGYEFKAIKEGIANGNFYIGEEDYRTFYLTVSEKTNKTENKTLTIK